jgi:hypothetical protein
MAAKKIIVAFEAGTGGAEEETGALEALARETLALPDAECRVIPPAAWGAQGTYSEADLSDASRQAALLQQQFAWFESHRWGITPEAAAGAFRDVLGNPARGSLLFLYAFDRQRVTEAEFKFDRLYTAWVPRANYLRPALVLAAIAFVVAALPITLSLLFPDVLRGGWAILDLVALWAAGTLLWRGTIRRLRKYPLEQRETCGGCGHTNRFTSVVTFNCEKCGRDLSYELAHDPAERAVRVRQVKCPYCDGQNDLHGRRMMYTCRKCGVRQRSNKSL